MFLDANTKKTLEKLRKSINNKQQAGSVAKNLKNLNKTQKKTGSAPKKPNILRFCKTYSAWLVRVLRNLVFLSFLGHYQLFLSVY